MRSAGRVLRVAAALLIMVMAGGRCQAGQFWVSTTGSDTNPGTALAPFATIGKAMSLSTTVLRPGDTVTVRGGRYLTNSTISISKRGADTARYHLYAAQGERVLLDCSGMTLSGSNRGISLSGSFWHIRGFDVQGAGDNGMYVSGSSNIIEFCSFFENRDTGLQLGGGASFNTVINCDSYGNADPGQGNADGFAPKLDVGTGNRFTGCRAWQNSDDGWDGYMRGADDVSTTLEDCWCFMNGYLKNGSPSTGNGNGYKLGGSDTRDLRHNFTLKRCVSFDNRVKGFDQNNNRGSMTLLNCSGYRDGKNYSIGDTLAPGKVTSVRNCLSLGPYGTLHPEAVQQTNSWLPPFAPVMPADFQSVDTTGVRGPRKPDGSLPDLPYLRLAAGSPLIDAGTDVGLPFAGVAPDLGAFESGLSTGIDAVAPPLSEQRELLGNFPNPFNGSTEIRFRVRESGWLRLVVVDLLGREVATLTDGPEAAGDHAVRWDASSSPSGVYFAFLRGDRLKMVHRIMLIR